MWFGTHAANKNIVQVREDEFMFAEDVFHKPLESFSYISNAERHS